MDWTRGQTIGHGSSGTVSMAKAKRSGQVFAVKSAELLKSESLQREQSILSTLKCPQIVVYKGCDITNENGKLFYNLFLEYISGGTLIDAIREGGGCLDEAMIRLYARTILLGLEYLHCNGIVHCDIKGHNILVTGDGAKIADLGCAKRVDEVSGDIDLKTTAPIAGTPLYMAPEVARGEHQGFPADIWSVGCTVVEMATGQAPWVNVSDPVSALYQIGFSGNVPEIPNFMSKQAKDFLSKCLKRDPGERWSASELLKHDFITEEPNSALKEIISSTNVDTPTCVLDQVLWDSIEELETTWDLSQESPSVSPVERIKQLTEGNGEVPNWSWDDTWITVRSNEQEMVPCSEDYNLAYASGNIGHSGAEITWASMEYDFVFFLNELTYISGNKTSSSGSCGDGSRHKILLMPCECRKVVYNREEVSIHACKSDLVVARTASQMRWKEGGNSFPALLRPVFFLFFAAPSTACRPVLFKKSMRKLKVAWWAYSFTLTLLASVSAEYANEVKGPIASAKDACFICTISSDLPWLDGTRRNKH